MTWKRHKHSKMSAGLARTARWKRSKGGVAAGAGDDAPGDLCASMKNSPTLSREIVPPAVNGQELGIKWLRSFTFRVCAETTPTPSYRGESGSFGISSPDAPGPEADGFLRSPAWRARAAATDFFPGAENVKPGPVRRSIVLSGGELVPAASARVVTLRARFLRVCAYGTACRRTSRDAPSL
jgi:hypothetical protein